MGSAVAAIAGGTHAIQWNPAGIARATVPMGQLGLGFNPSNSDLQVNTSILYPFPDGTVFALSQFSDFPASPTSNTTYIGSVALPLNSARDFLFGVNLKYLALSTLVGSTTQNGRGLGLDFGLSYDLRRPQGTIASFALAVKDAGTQVRFNNTDEQAVTRTFILGVAYENIPDTRIESDLQIVDQTLQNSSLHNRLRLGAERFFGDRFYSVRMGYDDLFNNDGYFTLGAGYHPAQPFEVSYAFRASVNNSQFTHYLSFIYRFDDFGKKEPAIEKAPSAITESSEINIASGADLTEAPPSTGKPVSAVPLRKMIIQVDPPIFSPSGRQKTTAISFPEGKTVDVSRWVLEFQNSSQKPVRRVGGTGPLVPMVLWDGINEEGKQVADGKYRVALKTFNRKNEMLSDDFENVEILSTRSHFEIQTTSRYFSTNAGKKRKNEIVFTVLPGGTSEVQNWDFEVSEASTNKVVFESQGQAKLPKTIRWNGKNLNSGVAPDGTYLCLLIAQDKAGNSLKTDALQITINNTPPELTLTGEDNLVDFNVKKNFRFSLAAGDRIGFQNWRMDLLDETGSALMDFGGNGTPPKSVVWDGKSRKGEMVQPGNLLSAVFSATDNAGNFTVTDPFTLQVDYQPPQSGEQMTLNLTTVYFAIVSSDLGEESKKELEKAASSIRPYLNKSILVVKGYAAPTETGDLLSLSRNRAMEVKKFLSKTLGISPDTIYAVGYGSRAPSKATNDAGTGESPRRAIITLTTKP